MSDSPPKLRLTVSVLLGLVAFGVSPILVRLAYGVSPIALAAYRTLFAAVILLPVWLISRKRKIAIQHYSSRQKWMGAFAGICLGIHFILWIASLSYTSVASASVLVTIHPIILILVESVFMKRRFHKLTWLGVFIAFAGSALLGMADEHTSGAFAHPLYGDFLAISAAVVFVIYFLIGQNLRQHSTWIDYVFRVYTFAAIACLGLVFMVRVPVEVSVTVVLVGLGLAIGPQIVGHGSINYAVKYVSPTVLATMILSEPLLATILAYWIFDEVPSLQSLLSMSVIMAGVLFTWRSTSAEEK